MAIAAYGGDGATVNHSTGQPPAAQVELQIRVSMGDVEEASQLAPNGHDELVGRRRLI